MFLDQCNSIDVSNKTKLDHDHFLNLPDLKYVELCKERYGINKGVYNTIDLWFFEQGIKKIIIRRFYILAFLDRMKRELPKNEDDLKFGHGGLTKKLNVFIQNFDNRREGQL
ncbi:hypothetical protein ACFFHM_19810 [Halalkalibacter kiskunsagensis]|uniref:Uncharacterized protein n=1 Tax=Halalkalibacter kiskunsagensis TaxID=1548599 RepID=A0ABV6KHC7_9BACI